MTHLSPIGIPTLSFYPTFPKVRTESSPQSRGRQTLWLWPNRRHTHPADVKRALPYKSSKRTGRMESLDSGDFRKIPFMTSMGICEGGVGGRV